jgi:hypothetical protein
MAVDYTTPTNHDRAKWAQAAIDEFQVNTGTDKDDAIADLIADLCHLAKYYGQDAMEQARRGLGMYVDERDYPPDGCAPHGKSAKIKITINR